MKKFLYQKRFTLFFLITVALGGWLMYEAGTGSPPGYARAFAILVAAYVAGFVGLAMDLLMSAVDTCVKS